MGLFSRIKDAVVDVADFAGGVVQSVGGLAKEAIKSPPVQVALSQNIGSILPTGGKEMGLIDTFTGGLTTAAQTLANIASPINTIGSFFGSDTPVIGSQQQPIVVQGAQQQPAQAVGQAARASETAQSGSLTLNVGTPMQTQQAGFGAFLPQLIGGARALIKSPVAQAIGLGGAGAIVGSLGNGQVSKMKFRTKDVRLARSVYNATDKNLQVAAQILRVDPFTLSQMLMQKLPERSVVPTTAAIRKTRKTVRQLERMCNLRDDIAKMAKTTTRRRTTARKTGMSTTLIKN
jgi:hypothetical protein